MNESIAGGSPSVLRGLNLRMALRKVRESGPSSRADLMRQTGLSRPTINDVVASLLATELLVRVDADVTLPTHRPGPARDLFEFNASVGTLLGVDVGAAKTRILLADMAGGVFARARLNTRAEPATTFCGKVRGAIASLLRENDRTVEDLRQAVISTPGTVDPDSEQLMLAPQLPSLNGEDVAALLGLGCPTLIENEMRAAVVGERSRGVAQGEDDVVYVGVGVGVGAGLVLRGELHRGVSGAAGEIGYLNFTDQTRTQGGLGALDALAGADAFAARGRTAAAGERGAALSRLAGSPGEVTPRTIIEAAKLRDPLALELVSEEASHLARAIAVVVAILDPSMVVLGGGISQAGAILLEPVREHLAALTPGMPPAVVQSQLGDEAAAIGAICLAVSENDRLIERSFGIGD